MRNLIPHAVMRSLSILFVFILYGCSSPGTDIVVPSPSHQRFVSGTVTPTNIFEPTLMITPTLSYEGVSTPTASSYPTITPSPNHLPEDWEIAYVANIVDDPKNPTSNFHVEARTVSLQDRLPVRLTKNYVNTTDPKWSPDGRRIAFISLDQNPNSLVILDIVSAQEYELPDGSTFDWSRDGQSIVYCSWGDVSKPAPEHYPCFVADITDLTHPRRVINPAWRTFELHWSPIDDRILAVGAREVGEDQSSHFYLFDLDGIVQEVKKQMVPWGQITWNSDGKEITYAPNPDFEHRSNLRTIDLGSKTEREITNINEIAHYPQWSPDGTLLAYTVRPVIDLNKYYTPSNRPDIEKIQVLDYLTGKTIEISSPKLDIVYPAWSPDGKYLAYLQAVVYPSINPFSTNAFLSGLSLKVLSIETGKIFTLVERGVYGRSASWRPQP